MEVNLELMLGRKVLAGNGRSIGRLEDVTAEVKPGECLVIEYLVGKYALFERLAAWSMGRAFLSLFGSLVKSGYRVPWQKMDISDPRRPKITCDVSELPMIEAKKS